jgi:predicted dehydrogenase
MAGHIERFNPAVQEAARRVQQGEVGRVLQITARRAGALRVPPRDLNVVHDSAIHDIDTARLIAGTEVAEAYAAAVSGVVTTLENAIAGVLRFEASDGPGPIATLEVNWLSPRRLRDLVVLGEQGLLVLDYAAQTLDFYRTPEQRTGPVRDWADSRSARGPGGTRIDVEPREQLVAELEAFVAALRSGGPLPVSARDALAALAVADALTESARSSRPVVPERIE